MVQSGLHGFGWGVQNVLVMALAASVVDGGGVSPCAAAMEAERSRK